MPILLRSWHFVPRRDTGNDFIQANDRLATVLAKPASHGSMEILRRPVASLDRRKY
jgi:hypothetical protein